MTEEKTLQEEVAELIWSKWNQGKFERGGVTEGHYKTTMAQAAAVIEKLLLTPRKDP